MTEEGDNPTVSGRVQSTAMESLNDELTPKTEKPQQEVKSENNIRHEISGFQKFLTTSVQVIRLHWIPILISSIICFVLNSDIAETSLAMNLFAFSFNVFAILLMFKLIKGEDKGNSEVTTSLEAGMDNVVKSNEEIDNFKIESTEKIANMENGNKLKTEVIESLQNLVATIHAKFTEISKLKNHSRVYSEPTKIDGISWKMNVYKGGDNFNFWLCAEKENAVDWYCPVITEFRLISQKWQEIVRTKEAKLIYSADDSSGCIESISFKDLFEKGYVKDDSITVAVAIRAFPRSIDEAKKIILRSQFSEISKLSKDKVYSQPTEFEEITWKMSVGKYYDDNRIFFYLDAEKENSVEWWFPVFVDLHLVSQKKSGEIVRIHMEKKIYDEHDRSGCIGFIKSKDLFIEKNGYVKDDSIIVVMNITVLPIN